MMLRMKANKATGAERTREFVIGLLALSTDQAFPHPAHAKRIGTRMKTNSWFIFPNEYSQACRNVNPMVNKTDTLRV